MQEKITQIRRLILGNNVKDALEELYNLVEDKEEFEDISDEIIILQTTNAQLLFNEQESVKESDYKDLIKDVLTILKKIKNSQKQNTSNFRGSKQVGKHIQPIIPLTGDDSTVKIAYLIPSPIDKKMALTFNQATSFFKNYNVSVDCHYLNLETLRNLEGYDYIFVRSQIFKDKIYIENERLESQVISISDLEDNVVSGFKGLVLIAEGNLDLKHITIPFIQIKCLKVQTFNSFLFKCFTKKKLELLANDSEKFIVKNATSFNIMAFPKGHATINQPAPELPIGLDKKTVSTFVGRHDDQTKLTLKIQELSYSGKILTVKGSGGIGKTTLVNKIAIELAYRNYFKDKINFVACEHISNYDFFEAKIANCFGMDNIVDFPTHIKKYARFDKLIILDNFETLLNFEDQTEIDKIKSLARLISSYASIIITSRETIGFEYEEVMPLGNIQTDDALQLFLRNAIVRNLSEEDKKILRVDIIENLLNNNPLAIKIISSPKLLPS